MHNVAGRLGEAMEGLVRRGEMGTAAHEELMEVVRACGATAPGPQEKEQQQQQGCRSQGERPGWAKMGAEAIPDDAALKGCLQSHPLAMSMSVSSVFEDGFLRQSQIAAAGVKADARSLRASLATDQQVPGAGARAGLEEMARMQEVRGE